MKPDAQKAIYGAKLIQLLTEALRVAGVSGIEQIGHITNFQPFKGADGRVGAFIDVGVWMAADAEVQFNSHANVLEAINAAIIRAYFRKVTCCVCKSDMSYNTHHWEGCPLKEFKTILAPAYPELWEKASKDHTDANNEARKNRG